MSYQRTTTEALGLKIDLRVDPAILGHGAAQLQPAHLAEFLIAFCAEVNPRSLSTASAKALTVHVENAARVSQVLTALKAVTS